MRQHPWCPAAVSPQPVAATFAAALRAWRLTRGLLQAALAKRIMYSRSLVNLVENGYRQATEPFARAADTALDAAGQLRTMRSSTTTAPAPQPVTPPTTDTAAYSPNQCNGRRTDAALHVLAPDNVLHVIHLP